LPQQSLVAIRKQNTRTFGDHAGGDRAPYPARAAGDEHALAAKCGG